MKNETILLIDDEVEILNLLERFLTGKGYRVYTAENLTEGKRQIIEFKPDHLFLDINLPDGNGIRALASIKSYSPLVNIIMMSAIDHDNVRAKAKLNGAHSFLSKPFNFKSIEKILKNQHPKT